MPTQFTSFALLASLVLIFFHFTSGASSNIECLCTLKLIGNSVFLSSSRIQYVRELLRVTLAHARLALVDVSWGLSEVEVTIRDRRRPVQYRAELGLDRRAGGRRAERVLHIDQTSIRLVPTCTEGVHLLQTLTIHF